MFALIVIMILTKCFFSLHSLPPLLMKQQQQQQLNHSVSWIERLEADKENGRDMRRTSNSSTDDDFSSTSSEDSTTLTRTSSSNGIFDTNDRWQVTYTDLTTNATYRDTFDVVMICNGRYAKPKIPCENELKGIKAFPGKVIHTHDYRIPEAFKGQNVLVLGAGPSGLDVAIELANVVNHVYLVYNLDTEFLDMPPAVTCIRSSIQGMLMLSFILSI